jgi:hypothetical protein
MDAISCSGVLKAINMKQKPKSAKKSRPATKAKVQNERLKGWNEIASFLGQPITVAQRWARSGMPVTRKGRFMYASREELSQYLGREAGLDVPVHIATENADLSADLKRALAHARAGNQVKKQNTKR